MLHLIVHYSLFVIGIAPFSFSLTIQPGDLLLPPIPSPGDEGCHHHSRRERCRHKFGAHLEFIVVK